MKNQQKTIKRAKKKAVLTRFWEDTVEWLEGQKTPKKPSVPAVVNDIVEEKRRNSQKTTG
jgi:hypothetical protein